VSLRLASTVGKIVREKRFDPRTTLAVDPGIPDRDTSPNPRESRSTWIFRTTVVQ
jgi:hypothetical protein